MLTKCLELCIAQGSHSMDVNYYDYCSPKTCHYVPFLAHVRLFHMTYL